MTGAVAPHRWHVLAWALLALGVLRLLGVVAHTPLAAYANQYDMARTSACLGLWPDGPVARRAAAHTSAPLDRYHYDEPRDDAACFASTEVAVAWVAMQFDRLAEALRGRSAHDFSLQQLAWFKALLIVLIAAWLDRRLAPWPRWRAGHAAVVALVLVDPFNSLYLGSLYTELEALLGLWLALGSALVLRLAARDGRAAARDVGWLLALGLVALGTSRVPHALLPAWLLAVIALATWRGARAGEHVRARALAPALVGVVLALALPVHNARVHPEITRANAVDSLFGAVLAASDTPDQFADRIGLPPNCAASVYATWYRGRGHDPLGECPQALSVSRFAVLAALAGEPATALRMFGRGVLLSSQWRLPYLGEIAGSNFANLDQPSLSAAIAPRGYVFQIVLWSLALWLFAWAAWRVWRRGDAAATVALALAGTVVMVWLISVLGDGYSELTRHLNLAQNAILVLWLLGIVRAAAWCWRRRATPRRAWPGALGVVAAFAISVAGAAAWARLPMAIGIFDVPNGESPVGDHFEARGWVVSVNGVEALRARLGTAAPVPLATKPDPNLAAFFAINHGRSVKRFGGQLRWPQAADGPLELHLESRESGRWREIDRVRLTRKPEPATLPHPATAPRASSTTVSAGDS